MLQNCKEIKIKTCFHAARSCSFSAYAAAQIFYAMPSTALGTILFILTWIKMENQIWKKYCVCSTYLSGNHETGEQVPQCKEEGQDNGSNLLARSQCDNHHSVQCENDKRRPHEVEEQEEFSQLPLESYHRVKDKNIHDSLSCHIYYLYCNLQHQGVFISQFANNKVPVLSQAEVSYRSTLSS